MEACAASQAVTMHVVKKLKVMTPFLHLTILREMLLEQDMYGDLYTESNVAINPTHTHTAPGGYLQYFLYSLATMGFVQDTFDAQISGIVKVRMLSLFVMELDDDVRVLCVCMQAIRMAHESAVVGQVSLSKGELLDASINRSPTAYLNNPREERARYSYDTDKTMVQLKFLKESGRSQSAVLLSLSWIVLFFREIGLLNWFAVHGTALNNSVTLISGDNKGAASQLFEKYIGRQRSGGGYTNRSSEDAFVAGFAQSNSGDVSPNTGGAFCSDTQKPCEISTSTCGGRNELCHGRGPGWPDSFRSSGMIAEKQFLKAKELYEKESFKLKGSIDARSLFLNISSLSLKGNEHRDMCRPAMGYSFAAGTTDGGSLSLPGLQQSVVVCRTRGIRFRTGLSQTFAVLGFREFDSQKGIQTSADLSPSETDFTRHRRNDAADTLVIAEGRIASSDSAFVGSLRYCSSRF